jgi:hypothetical protein
MLHYTYGTYPTTTFPSHHLHKVTGEQLLLPHHIPDDIEPIKFSPMGNYAVQVDWTMFPKGKGAPRSCDRCIYAYDRLHGIAEAHAPAPPPS